MEDFEKDIQEENKSENIDENADNKGLADEESSYAEINKDSQESTQAYKTWSEPKDENNAEEETANAREGTYNQEQGEDNSKEAELNNSQYSTYYKPPYYVPNFTTVDPTPQPDKNNKKTGSNKTWKFIAIGIVSLLLVILLAVVGLFAYAVFKFKINDNSNAGGAGLIDDFGDEEIIIVQNIPKLDIVQNPDVDYVPQTLPEVVNKVGDSVVEIKTSSRIYDRFYGQYVTSGAGSGVIVAQTDKYGYLLTNHHVIHNEDGSVAESIVVVLANGEEYNAERFGTDSSKDLSLLRITKKAEETFKVANFGDSSNLVVGQDVIAIGNPLGSLGGTVTDGIISALDRRVQIDDVSMVLLQHNAAINPGNSGGGLFDMMGNLVGIVNAKTSDTGIEGLGFAIPSNIALDFFNRTLYIEPILGIRVTDATLNNVQGVYVVEPTSSKSVFKTYDRIVDINGQSITNTSEYYAVMESVKVGDNLVVVIERNSKKYEITVQIT